MIVFYSSLLLYGLRWQSNIEEHVKNVTIRLCSPPCDMDVITPDICFPSIKQVFCRFAKDFLNTSLFLIHHLHSFNLNKVVPCWLSPSPIPSLAVNMNNHQQIRTGPSSLGLPPPAPFTLLIPFVAFLVSHLFWATPHPTPLSTPGSAAHLPLPKLVWSAVLAPARAVCVAYSFMYPYLPNCRISSSLLTGFCCRWPPICHADCLMACLLCWSMLPGIRLILLSLF